MRGEDMPGQFSSDELLTPAEVARLFRVNTKTVSRWERAGKLTAIRTLGGHRRYRAADIRSFMVADTVVGDMRSAG